MPFPAVAPRGNSLVEYALPAGLILVLCLPAIPTLQSALGDAFRNGVGATQNGVQGQVPAFGDAVSAAHVARLAAGQNAQDGTGARGLSSLGWESIDRQQVIETTGANGLTKMAAAFINQFHTQQKDKLSSKQKNLLDTLSLQANQMADIQALLESAFVKQDKDAIKELESMAKDIQKSMREVGVDQLTLANQSAQEAIVTARTTQPSMADFGKMVQGYLDTLTELEESLGPQDARLKSDLLRLSTDVLEVSNTMAQLAYTGELEQMNEKTLAQRLETTLTEQSADSIEQLADHVLNPQTMDLDDPATSAADAEKAGSQ